MSERKPLVISDGQVQQLQSGDSIDIPLEQQFLNLEFRFNILVQFLIAQGIELPDEVINL